MKMKYYGALAFAACLLLAQPVRAAIDIQVQALVGNTVKFSDTANRATNGGGPFLGNIAGDTWRTFCVEADGGSENVSLGATYYVVGTSPNTATATGNTITEAAKFLYYAYGHDLLTLGNSGAAYSDTSTNNNSLQQAIWSLVVKMSAGNGINDYSDSYTGVTETYWLQVGALSADAATWRSFAIAAVTGANATANLALADRIRVINPDDTYPASGAQAQSMLYEIVPEPASIVVWSLLAGGAAGLSVVKRRRPNASAGRWTDESRSAIFAIVDKGSAHD